MKPTRTNIQMAEQPGLDALPGTAYFNAKYNAWLRRRGLNEANEGFARGRGWRSKNKQQKA